MNKISTIEVSFDILKKEKGSLDIKALFDKACKVIEIDENEYYDRLALFHTHLTMDGRFVILADGTWDLRENHPFEVANIASTDFELDIEDEFEEDEEDYEGLEVTVASDEDDEDGNSDKDQIKDIIGIVQEEI